MRKNEEVGWGKILDKDVEVGGRKSMENIRGIWMRCGVGYTMKMQRVSGWTSYGF